MSSPLNSMNCPNIDGLDLLVGPLELSFGSLGQERIFPRSVRHTVDGRILLQKRRKPGSAAGTPFLLRMPGMDGS